MLTNYMCSCMLNGKDHQANKACKCLVLHFLLQILPPLAQEKPG